MTDTSEQWWPEYHSEYDWRTAIDKAEWYIVGPDNTPATFIPPKYTADDIDMVLAHYVSYEGEQFNPGVTEPSTELMLRAMILFEDGAIGFLSAGNDYTGWDCQDYSEMRVGSWSDVVRYGMGNEDRALLNLTLPEETPNV